MTTQKYEPKHKVGDKVGKYIIKEIKCNKLGVPYYMYSAVSCELCEYVDNKILKGIK